MSQAASTQATCQQAREAYAALGVDTEQALARLDRVPISMHCWQGDDVRGFENPQGALTGGISATDRTARLAFLEEQKSLPWGAAWDAYCERKGVPLGAAWLGAVRAHEERVQRQRGG